MIVLGPYTSSVGTQIINTPISTDVKAIGLLNASPYFMTVTSAGTYANMAVPPYTADVFASHDTASSTINVTFTNLSVYSSSFTATTYTTFYIYLYGSGDYISEAIYNGVSTGYPYSLSGLADHSPFRNNFIGKVPTLQTTGILASTTTTSSGGSLAVSIGGSYLWGFDLTLSNNTTSGASRPLTITDLVEAGNNLIWQVPGLTNLQIGPLIVRFPFPLPIMGGQAPNQTFGDFTANVSLSAIGTATISFTAYASN